MRLSSNWTLLLLSCLATLPARAGQRFLHLGKDDITGQAITLRLGKSHPFLSWTLEEVEEFKGALRGDSAISRGARYGWNHPANGPIHRWKKGDPLACGNVIVRDGVYEVNAR